MRAVPVARGMNATDFLDRAAEIAHRLCRQALWRGNACTWRVAAPEGSAGREVTWEEAGAGLYAGASGIALFLGEFHRLTGDAAARQTALGAIRHARARRDELTVEAPFGFHVGPVGLAWALVRLARALGAPELAPAGVDLLRPMAGRRADDQVLDVIGGAAGAIPALLLMHEQTGVPFLVKLACALGERLLATANRGPAGWSWPLMHPWVSRNPSGLAHGAAGVGWALVELFAATGSGRFRYAAEQAFRYERALFVPAECNWLDVRCLAPTDYVEVGREGPTGRSAVSGDLPGLRAAWMDGRLQLAPRSRGMVAWCHGAPGIGLTRLRAFELLRSPRYRREARFALRSTAADLAGGHPGADLSLCHGLGGSLELLLQATARLAEPGWRILAEQTARDIMGRHPRGVPWPSGTPAGTPTPDLMVGEAGVGLLFLRLHDPTGVPSVLFACGPGRTPVRATAGRTRDARRVRRDYVDEWFGGTIRTLGRLGALPRSRDPRQIPFEWGRADVSAAHGTLARGIGRMRGRARDAAREAFRPERARFLLARRGVNVADGFLEQLLRESARAVDWTRERVVRSPRVVMVGRRQPGECGGHALLPHRDHVIALALSPFEWTLLRRLTRPLTLDELRDALRRPACRPARAVPARTVATFLQRAWTVGLVRSAGPAPARDAGAGPS
jgi:lantibiotic biosynthesis protein